ncbi:hypothetical protein E3G69_000288 [Mycobacteroides abscessus]|nr:hypothetical protein [Mycobacteroides abscessus]QOF41273.1 hypothetical protein E3G69_000288 [Mycobacteroides abscessus]QOF45971.1 hypothetical protein E3G70_000286 [Mycobacteroides abscessus]
MASAGPLEAVVVDEGQDVVASTPEGAAELGDLLRPGRYAAAYRVDQLGHCLLAAVLAVCLGEDLWDGG